MSTPFPCELLEVLEVQTPTYLIFYALAPSPPTEAEALPEAVFEFAGARTRGILGCWVFVLQHPEGACVYSPRALARNPGPAGAAATARCFLDDPLGALAAGCWAAFSPRPPFALLKFFGLELRLRAEVVEAYAARLSALSRPRTALAAPAAPAASAAPVASTASAASATTAASAAPVASTASAASATPAASAASAVPTASTASAAPAASTASAASAVPATSATPAVSAAAAAPAPPATSATPAISAISAAPMSRRPGFSADAPAWHPEPSARRPRGPPVAGRR